MFSSLDGKFRSPSKTSELFHQINVCVMRFANGMYLLLWGLGMKSFLVFGANN